MNLNAVVRKGNSWFVGRIENGKFIKERQIKRLKDFGDASSYITLKKFIKDNNLNSEMESKIIEGNELKSVYVLPEAEKKPLTEEDWWATLNDKCIGCCGKCKQSSYVDIVRCPDYKKKV